MHFETHSKRIALFMTTTNHCIWQTWHKRLIVDRQYQRLKQVDNSIQYLSLRKLLNRT